VESLVLKGGVAGTLFWAAQITWWGAENYTMLRHRGQGRLSSDPTAFAMAAGLIGGIAVAIFLASAVHGATISGGRAWPVVAGFLIMALGLGLRAWSVLTLGPFFIHSVSVVEGHQVVEHGPYRRLRHPSYTGLLVICAGVGLTLDNWLALAAVMLLPLAAVLIRIRAEEQALGRELGDAYRSYSMRTRRLVPGVW
jgi:protein-S-isoprenylcysteine O-methyltransferase Ste14